jgi:hypothetical protein
VSPPPTGMPTRHPGGADLQGSKGKENGEVPGPSLHYAKTCTLSTCDSHADHWKHRGPISTTRTLMDSPWRVGAASGGGDSEGGSDWSLSGAPQPGASAQPLAQRYVRRPPRPRTREPRAQAPSQSMQPVHGSSQRRQRGVTGQQCRQVCRWECKPASCPLPVLTQGKWKSTGEWLPVLLDRPPQVPLWQGPPQLPGGAAGHPVHLGSPLHPKTLPQGKG